MTIQFYFRCVYRFEAQRDERIRIIIRKIYTKNRQCLSRIDSDTKRSYCFGDTRAKVEVGIIIVIFLTHLDLSFVYFSFICIVQFILYIPVCIWGKNQLHFENMLNES